MWRILYQIKNKAVKRLTRLLEVERKKSKRYKNTIREYRKIFSRLHKKINDLESEYIIEWCAACERQVVISWNTETDGLKAYCPHCGEVMMLCDYCHGECDYDFGIEVCKEM